MKNLGLVIILVILILCGLWLYNCTFGKTDAKTGKNNILNISADTNEKQNNTNQLPNPANTVANSPTPAATKTITGDFSVPILMYHYIRVNPDPADEMGANLSVSPDVFREQMQYLKNNGYEAVNVSQILNDDGKKKIAITFDDGYKDAIENAYPALNDFNFPATVFVITEKVGQDGYLSWEDIINLKNAGWEIGSHTLNHPNLVQIVTDSAKNEITESKKILEEKLKTTINSFCYPAGKYDETIINLLKDAGYKYATTTNNGYNNNTDNLLELSRVRINGSDGVSGFENKIP